MVVTYRTKLVFRWDESCAALHRSNTLDDVIPDLIRVALGVEAQQLKNADKLEMHGAAVGVLVAVTGGSASLLGFAQGSARMRRCERDNALLADSSFASIAVHNHAKLEEQPRGISSCCVGIIVLLRHRSHETGSNA